MTRVTGLSVRDELERRPHNPFEVDAERAADALGIKWSVRYRINACRGGFEAVRRHGPRVTLTASTPDDLDRAMSEDSL